MAFILHLTISSVRTIERLSPFVVFLIVLNSWLYVLIIIVIVFLFLFSCSIVGDVGTIVWPLGCIQSAEVLAE